MNHKGTSSNKKDSCNFIKNKLEYYEKLRESIKPTYESVRLALIYIVFGSLWILFSDKLLLIFIEDFDRYKYVQTFKGWFYVFFSGVFFYFIIKNRMVLFKNATDEIYGGYRQISLSNEELISATNELQEKYEQLNYYKDALEESETNYNLLVQGANDGFWHWDIKKDEYNTSIMAKKNFGYVKKEQAEVNTMPKWFKLVHPEDFTMASQKLEDYINNDIGIYENIIRIKTSSGDYRWILSRGKLIRDYKGDPLRLVGSHSDLTEFLLLQKNLHQEKEMVDSISKEAPIGILVCDKKGIVKKVNNYAQEIFEYTEEEILGKNIYEILIDDVAKDEFVKRLDEVFDGNSMNNFEKRMIVKNGSEKTILWNNSFIQDLEGLWESIVFIGVDISERKKMEEKLGKLAYFDPLTNLGNKEKLKEDTDKLIFNNDMENTLAMVYMDIDNFKLINDTMGHAVGDELIRHVGQSIIDEIGTDGKVYRFGGDEFVILISNISMERIDSKMTGLSEKIRIPWTYHNQVFHTSASSGVAIYPEHGNDFDQLMQNADTALSYAKEDGKDKYVIYSKEMREKTWSYIQMSNDLRSAVENNEFELYYQPQIDLRNNTVAGVEALIRWNHPSKGLVSPFEFIPFSEETGQIDKIEEWVIDEACNQSETWHKREFKNFALSLNVSGTMLGKNEWIEKIQEKIHGCKGNRKIIFEITETAIISEVKTSFDYLKEIHDLGIKLALDDFGTGYSSLTYLGRLPIDVVKLDKGFIWAIGSSKKKEYIIKAVIDLAHNLGMEVVAEGVETAEQLQFLKDSGCDIVQGYYYSKPLKIKDIEEYLIKY